MKDPDKVKSFYSELDISQKHNKLQKMDFMVALEYCGWLPEETDFQRNMKKKVQAAKPHCCFNHQVGLPRKYYRDDFGNDAESEPLELYDYERKMIKQYESHHFYAQNKIRGAGATEILPVRHLAYKYAVENLIYGRKAIIIAGINQSLAINTLRRIINLLKPVSFVFAVMPSQTSPTKLIFKTGGEILALSADPDAARGLENVGDVILDEAAFWGLIEDELVLKAVEPFVSKSGAHIGILSTPNGQRGFFYDRIFNPDLPYTKYHRHTVTLDEIKNVPVPLIDIEEVEKIRILDPDLFAQEFNNQFILPSFSVFGDQFARGNFECEF